MSDDDRVYCGHRAQQVDCPGCFHYNICPHCGEQMIYFDMFDIPWCYEIYTGVKEQDERSRTD